MPDEPTEEEWAEAARLFPPGPEHHEGTLALSGEGNDQKKDDD